MDINKFEELLEINYSRKQLKNIFFNSMCRNINNLELENIKEALYEIVPIGQYSPSTFCDLIQILKILPNKALKSIENGEFINIYNKVSELQKIDKRDFSICNKLLLLLYTDYKNINNIKEFNIVSETFFELNNIGDNVELNYMVSQINSDLAKLLIETKIYYDLGPKYVLNFKIDEIVSNLNNLFRNMLTTFLMHIEIFEYKYNLPCDIILLMCENMNENVLNYLETYKNCENEYIFSKNLLTKFNNLDFTEIIETNNKKILSKTKNKEH